MARFAGFVRAVMIGREGLHRPVLLDAVAAAGGIDPVSFISTGNVAFSCDPESVDMVRARLERAVAGVVGRSTPVFVRSIGDLVAIAEADPFADQPFGDDAHDRIVSFADEPFEPLPADGLWSKRGDVAVFRVRGREAFGVTRLIDGTTSAPGGMLERRHGAPLTSRAWSTIDRIIRLEAGSQSTSA